ncbi:alcohol dehydrogenase-like 1 protein [Tanacetum coccineum]
MFKAMTNMIPDVITCKAAVVREAGGVITVEEINIDPPKASEVRIKMLCASICHTDILTFVSSLSQDMKGSGAQDGREHRGRRGYKGETRGHSDSTSYIVNVDNAKMSIAATGETIYHQFSCSTWSEYMIIDVNFVLKVDREIPLPYASFLSCGFTTGFGAPLKEASVHSGSSVAVFGLGVVGLGVIKGAQMQGASKIIRVDINDKKSAKGKVFGMTDFINPQNHPGTSFRTGERYDRWPRR